MSGGGSSQQQPSGTTTTVQKADPWSGQQPYLAGGNTSNWFNPDTQAFVSKRIPGTFQSAFELYDAGGPQYFPGQTYAPAGFNQERALSAVNDIAGGNLANPAATVGGAASASARNILSPEFLASNPGNAGFQTLANGPAMQAAVNSAVQNATPGLLDTFTQGNRLNSPGAAYGVSQGIANAAAPIVLAAQQAGAQGLSQNYGQAAQQQNQAALLAPQLQQVPYTDAAQLYGAGATEQGLRQNVINDQLSRYNYEQTSPYDLLNWYNASIGGSYGGTSTLESPYFAQSGGGGLGGALSGAMGGASLGSMFGPWGMGIGAVGGGLLGGLF